jgi:hypothetical protein
MGEGWSRAVHQEGEESTKDHGDVVHGSPPGPPLYRGEGEAPTPPQKQPRGEAEAKVGPSWPPPKP